MLCESSFSSKFKGPQSVAAVAVAAAVAAAAVTAVAEMLMQYCLWSFRGKTITNWRYIYENLAIFNKLFYLNSL